MNAEILIDNFDRISGAPDAIPRLRRFVLDLAVQGKLVEQEPNEEPALALLARIRAAKADVAREQGMRNGKPLPCLAADRLPFRIPANWHWTKLAEIGFLNPRNSADDDSQASFVSMPLISAEYGKAHSHEVKRWGDVKSGYTHFAEGDVALAKITPCFENGKSTVFRNLIGGIGAGTTELHVVRPLMVIPEYILIFLKSSHFITSGVPRMTGTAGQKRVPAEYFANSPFPLPPLAEQHRIVAKVDELMALCDRLEAARAEQKNQRHRLARASLHNLNNGGDEGALHEHTQFYLTHVTRLIARVEDIDALRQTILDLGVRGRLAKQDLRDGSVAELLKRTYAEKERLVKEGTIPRQKLATSRDTIGLGFRQPPNWEAVSFGSVCNLVTSGSRGWAEYYSESGPKFIRAQNIRFGKLRLDDLARVSLPKKTEGTRTHVSKGDLLIVITGAGVTNPALLDQELGEAYVSQHVALIKPTDTNLSRWLLLCLMAPSGGRAELVERAYGAGKPGLNLDNIRSLLIPLPPLAEQYRIVSKVDQLMALCDRLESQLTTTQTESRRLLEATLLEALGDSPKSNGSRSIELEDCCPPRATAERALQ